MPTRRELLGASGLAVASAGCLGLGEDDSGTAEASGGPESTEVADAETARLQQLSVQNNHDEAHQVQIAVKAGEEVLHLGNYDLEPAGGYRTVEGDWNSEAGSYRIHARLDEGEIRTTDVTEGIAQTTGCVRVLVRIDAEGRLGIYYEPNCER